MEAGSSTGREDETLDYDSSSGKKQTGVKGVVWICTESI